MPEQIPSAADGALQPDKPPIARFLGVGAAIFGGLGAVAKFTNDVSQSPILGHEHRWIFHLIPDAALAYLIIGSVTIASFHQRERIRLAISAVFHSGNRSQRFIIIALTSVAIALLMPLVKGLWALERSRLLTAKFDWHYYRAQEAIRHKRPWEALREFEIQGKRFNYLGAPFKTRLAAELADVQARIRDANNQVDRFSRSERSGSVDLSEILRIQRASILCADCPQVVEACKRAKIRMVDSLKPYWNGLMALRRQDRVEAVKQFSAGQAECNHFLDFDLLRRYAQTGSDAAFTPIERRQISHYLLATTTDLQEEVLRHPLVIAVQRLP